MRIETEKNQVIIKLQNYCLELDGEHITTTLKEPKRKEGVIELNWEEIEEGTEFYCSSHKWDDGYLLVKMDNILFGDLLCAREYYWYGNGEDKKNVTIVEKKGDYFLVNLDFFE